MIRGVGVDLVDLARFERAIERTPALMTRLFAESERVLPVRSLAGRFAAKEALIKAIGASDGLRWVEMAVVQNAEGSPDFTLTGGSAQRLDELGIARVHLSISHDAGAAVAMVVIES